MSISSQNSFSELGCFHILLILPTLISNLLASATFSSAGFPLLSLVSFGFFSPPLSSVLTSFGLFSFSFGFLSLSSFD